MPSTPVIAILDVGKTNKKLYLFDEYYNIVWDDNRVLAETTDEDGYPCEDLELLNSWMSELLLEASQAGDFDIRAVNYSAYGASFVHLGKDAKPLTPLYNYLKPLPEKIKDDFYHQYGGELTFSMLTASPVLGNLNSGMQLFMIKKAMPEIFSKISFSLHLPQYLSWWLTGYSCSDITSIGCHTNLWNFSQDYYHEWVYREQVINKLTTIQSSGMVNLVKPVRDQNLLKILGRNCLSGIGLHDSSAAVIPYLENFREPFLLISTGTWCISMNPFNTEPLTSAELLSDCLCYLTFKGRPMKASRLFAGYEHGKQVERLSEYFQKDKNFYSSVDFDRVMVWKLKTRKTAVPENLLVTTVGACVFAQRDLAAYSSFEEAYHRLMMDLVDQQQLSVQYILTDSIERIFVDGGFSQNTLYMHLLADAFPTVEVFAATISQASAMGAAMAIHEQWNMRSLPSDIIELKYYK